MNEAYGTIIQFCLPFEGLQDRLRAAVEQGKIAIMSKARAAMRLHDISDLLVHRAVRRGVVCGRVLQGDAKGEWRCRLAFKVKGFRQGGFLIATVSEGRVFVEDFLWDYSHEQ